MSFSDVRIPMEFPGSSGHSRFPTNSSNWGSKLASFSLSLRRNKFTWFFVVVVIIWLFLNLSNTINSGEPDDTVILNKGDKPVDTGGDSKPVDNKPGETKGDTGGDKKGDTGGETKPGESKPDDSTRPPTTKPLGEPISEEEITHRQSEVKKAFLHTWDGYTQFAWGFDELKPVSNKGDSNWGMLGATILDSIDTILIMGLDEPFKKAREFVSKLGFSVSYDASTFETTIRFVGGLLSAYELSNDKLFLDKAEELANRLLPAFNTPTGVPYATVNLLSGSAYSPGWANGCSFLSEFGSLQLEFKYLSQKTGKKIYAEKVEHIMKQIQKIDVKRFGGLYPVQYNPHDMSFPEVHITFGARGDSFYEYLLKQYLQTDKKDAAMFEWYKNTMEGMKNRLVRKSVVGNLTYIDQMHGDNLHEEMDHLVCFVPGMLALDDLPGHLDLAKEVMYTCWQFYEQNPTGIGPEIAGFRDHTVPFRNHASHYLLRPETVESLFILYRVTGDPIYQEWGWKIFNSIVKHCRTESGFSGIHDVGQIPAQKNDRMESFFLAETLKYLYLLFSPKTLIPLDEFVFNTEAHPTRKFTPFWK